MECKELVFFCFVVEDRQYQEINSKKKILDPRSMRPEKTEKENLKTHNPQKTQLDPNRI